ISFCRMAETEQNHFWSRILQTVYIEKQPKVRQMKVVSDCALVTSYSICMTKDEDQKQYLFRLVDLHRKKFQEVPKALGGLGGVVVIDAAFGAHGKSRPRFKPGTLLCRCSDLGQVVNLSLSVA